MLKLSRDFADILYPSVLDSFLKCEKKVSTPLL